MSYLQVNILGQEIQVDIHQLMFRKSWKVLSTLCAEIALGNSEKQINPQLNLHWYTNNNTFKTVRCELDVYSMIPSNCFFLSHLIEQNLP